MNKIAFIISIFATGFFMQSCKKDQEVTKPKLQDMVISVYASTTIEPENLSSVYSEKSGVIDQVVVEEGSVVTKGSVLAKINFSNHEYLIKDASLKNKLASEKLLGESNTIEILNKEIQLLKIKLTNDSLNDSRQRKLWDNNIGTKSEYDNKKLIYETTKSNYQLAQNKLKQTRYELKNFYEQSKNNLSRYKKEKEDYLIKYSHKAMVFKLFKNEGEFINRNELFALMGDPEKFILTMKIDEQDIAKIKLSQEVIVSLDAFKDTTFGAVVTKIFPMKEDRSQTYKVEAEFKNQPSPLYSGLVGEANIIISKKNNVLTIPLDYITESKGVIIGDKEIKPKFGLRNMQEINVLSGLDTTIVITKP